jgi:arylsulfatase A-like enzyme
VRRGTSNLTQDRLTEGSRHAGQAEHPRHLGRRHRHHQPQLLQRRADGLPHAEHRPDRRRGHAVHRRVREQSCTAGRAAFITGQSGYRTGLTKVGIPGATIGLRAEDPTIADLLKNQGYVTGQFGKNHLGDRNEFLPTVHGFDEFFGNLYHLNAEEEPELPDYPNEQEYPHFRDRFGPRGVLHCWATEEDDDTEHPRWGRVGKQRIEDTGPLTKKRMETCDDEFVPRRRTGSAARARPARRSSAG